MGGPASLLVARMFSPSVMINLCVNVAEPRGPDMWPNIILDVSTEGVWGEIGI